MQAHVVLAHPEARSFNTHLSKRSQSVLREEVYNTSCSDLYAMDFDPRDGAHQYTTGKDEATFHAQAEQRHIADNGTLAEEAETEIGKLLSCDLLIVHFPLWWLGPPAILKGWMDRVFVYGRVYRSQMRYDAGKCNGKKMIACVTTGANAGSCAFNGREGDTRLHLWPTLFAFRYLGFNVLDPAIFHGVGGVAFIDGEQDGLSTPDAYTRRWTDTLTSLGSRSSVSYNRDSEFGDDNRLHPGAPVHSPFIRQIP